MKNHFKKSSPLLLFVCLSIVFMGCKDDVEETEVVRIQNVVPQGIIEDLSNKGMVFNQGNKPPKLSLAIRVSPYELVYPYADEDPWKKGRVIGDYFYKFYGQTDKQEITYDYFNDGSDEGNGQGAFIIGSGNKFTIFSEDIGVSASVPYKSVAIISG